jgi:hypothetical protein
MKKTLLAAVFVLMIGTMGFASLSAETWLGQNVRNAVTMAPWRFGPFRLQLSLALRDAGYDTNVYGDYTNPLGDYSFTIGPVVNAYLPIKNKIVFHLSESPHYVYFLETRAERSWNNTFKGETYILLSNIVLNFGLDYSNLKQRISLETEIRPRVRTENIFGSVLYQFSAKTSLSIELRQNRIAFDNNPIEGFDFKALLDRKESYIALKSFYQQSLKGMYFLDLEYGSIDFAHPQNKNDSDVYAIRGGMEYIPSVNVSGKWSLGYRWMRPRTPGQAPFGGLVGDVQVSLRLMKPIRGRISFKRDMPFSMVIADSPYFFYLFGTGISGYPIRSIRLDYDFTFAKISYPGYLGQDLPGSSDPANYSHDFRTHSIGFFIRLKKNVGIGVTAGRWVQESLSFSNASNRNFIWASLTTDF